jgi:aminopeptidase N
MPIEQFSGFIQDNQQFGIHYPQAHAERDAHSFSNPHQVKVRHLDLELDVLFEERTLHGVVVLSLDRFDKAQPLILDTTDLRIMKVEVSANGVDYLPASFSLGQAHPILGAPLTIELPGEANHVRIDYFTSPGATGLQWLEPLQTAGKKRPFMFTQSETIHARSWIPLQDSPQVRVTYRALVRTPRDLLAVMSAANNPQVLGAGAYDFVMPQPIPSYLIALAVGELAFAPLGQRSGIYAEPPIVETASKEFADTEKMMEAIEHLYGPYLWGRYDMLVLPPSFPLGGMENPRLTFVTPTILAGDKSLVSLIAHELAHSWSGNLVTNATWSDFWLNEGFTVYVERRVLEEVYGRQREEMEAALGRQVLEEEMAALDERREVLHIDLKCHDPEECLTKVPYEKGALFLRQLEETFGRARFDQFLRGYFNHFAFQSITTSDFVAYLEKNLLEQDPRLASLIPITQWLYQPGLPASAPRPSSDAFTRIERQSEMWLQREITAQQLQTTSWTSHEWLHFLRCLPKRLGPEKMQQLDRAFHLTSSGNSEIAHQWLLMAVRNHYEPASERLTEFLLITGREKLIKPLYEELARSTEGKQRAAAIYSKARPTYHPLVITKVDKILAWKEG